MFIGVLEMQKPQIYQFPCLYTHQMTKKRKTWNEGFLRTNVVDQRNVTITLIDSEDCRQIGLESRILEPGELGKFFSKVPQQLKMENYIIDIFMDNAALMNRKANNQPPLQVKKFVAPSRIEPKRHKLDIMDDLPANMYQQSSAQQTFSKVNNTNAVGYGRFGYQVSVEDLDSMWGGPTSKGTNNKSYTVDENQNNRQQQPYQLEEQLPPYPRRQQQQQEPYHEKKNQAPPAFPSSSFIPRDHDVKSSSNNMQSQHKYPYTADTLSAPPPPPPSQQQQSQQPQLQRQSQQQQQLPPPKKFMRVDQSMWDD